MTVDIKLGNMKQSLLDKTKELLKPKDKKDDISSAISEIGFEKKIKVKLTKDERDKYEKMFPLLIQEYYDNMSTRLSSIREWRDMYDMVVTDDDYPWEDAMHSKLSVVALAINGASSKIHKMLWGADKVVRATTEDKTMVDKMVKFENWVNNRIKRKYDLPKAMKPIEFNAYEDGTGIAETSQVHEWKRVKERKVYTNLGEFHRDFPDFEIAGIKEKDYDKYIRKLEKGGQVQIDTAVNKTTHWGVKVKSIEREDFIILPAESSTIESAKGVGKRMVMPDAKILELVDMGYYDKIEDKGSDKQEWQNIDSLERYTTQEQQQKLDKAGINKAQNESITGEDEHYVTELVFQAALGNDKIARDYWFTFVIDPQHSTCSILQVIDEPYDHGQRKYSRVIAIQRKSDQFDGTSFCYLLRHVDAIGERAMNIYLNWWEMRMSPPVKVKNGVDEELTSDWKYKPGVFWFMDDTTDAMATQFAGGGTPDSMTIIMHQERMAELIIGIGAHGSGGENPRDPRAPASKTRDLIHEGNIRISEYAVTMKDTGINRIIEQVISLAAQFPDRDAQGDIKTSFVTEINEKEKKPEFDDITPEEMKGEGMTIGIDTEMIERSANRQIDKSDYVEMTELLLKYDQILIKDPIKMNIIRNGLMDFYEFPVRHQLKETEAEIEERQARMMARAMQIKEEEEKARMADLEEKGTKFIQDQIKAGKAAGKDPEVVKREAAQKLAEIQNNIN